MTALTDWLVYLWDRAVARWQTPSRSGGIRTFPAPPIRGVPDDEELVVPLRLLGREDLTDSAADRLLAFPRQPSEIVANESFIDNRTGRTWVYDGTDFVRTPEADVPSERAFMAKFLAENPEWPA